ncbi:hypothetical protein ACFL01_01625 [Planctomycetota bacterium]
MALGTVKIGDVDVSRFIIGGNPFSGFGHQTPERDREMKRYYTVARIKETLKEAEALGITTFTGRADNHVVRMLMEYWDEGGAIQWLAQTCPGVGPLERGITNSIGGGAKLCVFHGGEMDNRVLNNKVDDIPAAIQRVKDKGIPVGTAGHNPKVFEWAEENADFDFYLCSYYNSAHRDKDAEHVTGQAEWFNDEDRDIMVNVIQGLSKPVVHYKVMAAGRNDPKEAMEFVAAHLRAQDAACVGVFMKDNPKMLEEDLRYLEQALEGKDN